MPNFSDNTRTFFLLLLLTSCAKQHKRPIEVLDEERIQAGGAGGQPIALGGQGGEPTAMGGEGGEAEWINPEPDFQERLILSQSLSPQSCMGADNVIENGCGNAPLVEPVIAQMNEDAWVIEVCSGLSNSLQTSCEDAPSIETAIEWTAPKDGYYTLKFGSDIPGRFTPVLNGVSIRTSCAEPTSEIFCSSYKGYTRPEDSVHSLQARANQTFFFVMNQPASYKRVNRVVIHRTEAPEPPQIIHVEANRRIILYREIPHPAFVIHAIDPNHDIIGFHYAYLSDPEADPIILYEHDNPPHNFGPTVHEELLDIPGFTSSNNLRHYFTPTITDTIPPTATHLKIRAVDATGLTSDFTPPIPIDEFSEIQIMPYVEEGSPCEPSMADIPAYSPPDFYCLRRFDEPSYTWKSRPNISTDSQFELIRVFHHGIVLGIEAIVSTQVPENFIESLSLGYISESLGPFANGFGDRWPIERNELHRSITQIGERRYRLQSSWLITRPASSYDASLIEIGEEPITDLYVVLLGSPFEQFSDRVAFEDYPIRDIGQTCDPNFVTNLCEDELICIRSEDAYTCQASEDIIVPQIISARRTVLEKTYQPYLSSVRTAVELIIEDPHDLLLSAYTGKRYIDEDGEQRAVDFSHSIPIPIQDYEVFKQGSTYHLKWHEEFTWPSENEDPRNQQWFASLAYAYGEYSPWVEIPLAQPDILPENSPCNASDLFSICEPGTYCKTTLDQPNTYTCQSEITPQIQSIEAFFQVPFELNTQEFPTQIYLHPEALPSEVRVPHLFVELQGTADTSIEQYRMEIQMLDENNEPLIDPRVVFLNKQDGFGIPTIESDMAFQHNGQNNFFQANGSSVLYPYAKSPFDLGYAYMQGKIDLTQYPELLRASASVEALENFMQDKRIVLRLIKENGNHTAWIEAPLQSIAKLEEGILCDPESHKDICEDDLVCVALDEDSPHQCISVDALTTTCPDAWPVISLNDFRVEPAAENEEDEPIETWQQEGHFAFAPHLSTSTCSAGLHQHIFSFTAPENLVEPEYFQFVLHGANIALSIRRSCQWIHSEIACDETCNTPAYCEEIEFRSPGPGSTSKIAIIRIEPGQTVYILASKDSNRGPWDGAYQLSASRYTKTELLIDLPGNPPVATYIIQREESDGETSNLIEVTAVIPARYGTLREHYINYVTHRNVIAFMELLDAGGEVLVREDESPITLEYSASFGQDEDGISLLRFSSSPIGIDISDALVDRIHSIRLSISEKQFPLEPFPLVIPLEQVDE